MSDIMQQIQELQEQFSNLFEVDDLGQPAVDVPPSQNKIKKDRKTKDGKVELVSVEDELFPYEGDKKEQYRQKIIDTINAMIQGTATLEDLLQIVRQKKAPLKEAMELMEELLLERNKENRQKKERWELKTNRITKKEKKAIQDYAKEQGDEAKLHQVAADDYDHIYSQQPAKAPDGTPNSVAAYFNGKYQEMLRNKGRNEQNIADEVEPLTKKLKNRKHAFHDMVRGWTNGSEALEEAMELVEDLMSYIIETNLINNRDQYHISKKSVADTEEELKNNPLLHAQSLERMRFGYDNGKDDRKDVAKYRIGMHDGAKSPKHAYKPEYRYDGDSTPADRAEETKRRIKRAHSIETVEEALAFVEALIYEYTEEDRKEAAKKVLPKRQEEFEKAYKDYEEVHSKIDPERILNYKLTPVEQYRANKAATKLEGAQDRVNHALEVAGNVEKTPHGLKIKRNEALEEALLVLSELFDRPDLLDDIDTTLGSPVKKTIKRVLTPKKTIKEAIKIMESIINEYTKEDRKEAAKKVLPERKREYFSKYADVLDAADEVGSENVPDGNLKDLERAEKRYKHAEKEAEKK